MSTKQQVANVIGQITAYGTSAWSFLSGLSDLVGIISGLAGAALTVALAIGNYKIKAAQARMINADARRKEIDNEQKEHGNATK